MYIVKSTLAPYVHPACNLNVVYKIRGRFKKAIVETSISHGHEPDAYSY